MGRTAIREYQYAVGIAEELLGGVAHHNDARPRAGFSDDVTDRTTASGVEACGRLVEQQVAGIEGEHAGDGRAPRLATGQRERGSGGVRRRAEAPHDPGRHGPPALRRPRMRPCCEGRRPRRPRPSRRTAATPHPGRRGPRVHEPSGGSAARRRWSASPPECWSSPAAMRSSVDLPEPVAPSTSTSSPGATVSETDSSACWENEVPAA